MIMKYKSRFTSVRCYTNHYINNLRFIIVDQVVLHNSSAHINWHFNRTIQSLTEMPCQRLAVRVQETVPNFIAATDRRNFILYSSFQSTNNKTIIS